MLFSAFIFFLVVNFLFVGCGLQVPDTTQQLTLTGPVSLSVGNQPAEGSFTASGLDNDKIFVDRGKNYGTSPVLPYSWTVIYYNGNQPTKLVEDLSGSSYSVKFYKPGKYCIEISLRAAFESGVVVNAEVWTGKSIEVNVSQGSGYNASNFTPGLIISTSTGAAVMLTTNILVVRDWSNTTGYTQPTNNPVDNGDIPQPVSGRDGNFDASFNKGQEMQVNRNETIRVPIYGQGLCDKGNFSGIYYDSALLTFQSIESPGSWKITQKNGTSFSATNSAPSAEPQVICYLVFKATSNVGISGITWPSNMAGCAAGYDGRGLFLRGIDGSVRVK